jgi:hypothetical protein
MAGDEIRGVCISPSDRVLLEGFEPVIEHFGVGPQSVGRVRPLDEVLMQESHRRFDKLPVACEKEWKSFRPCLAQRHFGCLCCGWG